MAPYKNKTNNSFNAKKGGNKRGKKSRNRQTKIQLVFDEDQRKDYLKGFKKRKDQRRQKAREELDLRLKEEKKKRREEQREMLKSMFYTQRSIPEVEHLVEPVTYDLPNHTVTITSITDVDFQGKSNLLLGQNKDSDDEDETEDVKPSEEILTNEAKISFSNLQRNLKKAQNKKMRASKAVHMKQKIQQKKDRQQAKQKRSILKKRVKHKGGKK